MHQRLEKAGLVVSNTMIAAIWEGPNQPLTMEELLIPEPRFGEVLVEVAACGVCHTDLHVMLGDVSFPTPAVLGHEITGTVSRVGPGIEHIKPGQRVACSFMIPCGQCKFCAIGRDDMCERFFNYNCL